jgi:hypothetical protein
MPEPLALLTILKAAQRKKPTLSRTMDITIVERMVREAPLTNPRILNTSLRGTIPVKKTNKALMAGGTDSLIPWGLQKRNNTIKEKIIAVERVSKSSMHHTLTVLRLIPGKCDFLL